MSKMIIPLVFLLFPFFAYANGGGGAWIGGVAILFGIPVLIILTVVIGIIKHILQKFFDREEKRPYLFSLISAAILFLIFQLYNFYYNSPREIFGNLLTDLGALLLFIPWFILPTLIAFIAVIGSRIFKIPLTLYWRKTVIPIFISISIIFALPIFGVIANNFIMDKILACKFIVEQEFKKNNCLLRKAYETSNLSICEAMNDLWQQLCFENLRESNE
ncbi:MAG TPA: hypothetical protein VJ046_00655 [Candidatus Paceibacterota bacterium]|nr:hypothetical protein [Candidatus Paceibacterota bacterium]